MTVLTFVALAIGLVCLAGAELLVRGAASIASRFDIAPQHQRQQAGTAAP